MSEVIKKRPELSQTASQEEDDSKSRQTLNFPHSHILNPIHTHFPHAFTPTRILGAILRAGALSRRGDAEPCRHAQSAVPAQLPVLAHARAVTARCVPAHGPPCGAVPARAADRASAPAVRARACAGMLTRVCRHGRACWHGSEPCQHSSCQHRLCPVPAQQPCRHGPRPVPARPPSRDGACVGMHSGVCRHGRACWHRPVVPAQGMPAQTPPCAGKGAVPARSADRASTPPVPARSLCWHAQQGVPAQPGVPAQAPAVPARGVPAQTPPRAGTESVPAQARRRAGTPARAGTHPVLARPAPRPRAGTATVLARSAARAGTPCASTAHPCAGTVALAGTGRIPCQHEVFRGCAGTPAVTAWAFVCQHGGGRVPSVRRGYNRKPRVL
jgi:hypothetical protein